MGLGKTLSSLALICHFLDAASNLPKTTKQQLPRATLVIAPKSSESAINVLSLSTGRSGLLRILAIYNWEEQIRS